MLFINAEINPLEPKAWGDQRDAGPILRTKKNSNGNETACDDNESVPEAFRQVTRLSQHISYLKDFFGAYKDFTDAEIDTIEIILIKLYGRFGMDDDTNFDQFTAEDYPTSKEFTKPLFSIPSHHFLFNAGQINPQEYMDALQLEESEFSLIRYPERGTCLYRCGNERYLLQVIAPPYKTALFGAAGGR